MTVGEVLIQYESKWTDAQAGVAQARFHYTAAAAVLAIAAALFLTLGVYALQKQISFAWPALLVPVAAASTLRYGQYRQAGSRMWRLKRFYERAIQRVQGDWPRNGINGEAFNDSDHIYSRDLTIFGEGSLFELLCIARTGVGRLGLANYLLEAPSLEEIVARQQAVRELRDKTDLREDVALLGRFDFSESRWRTFTEWLDRPPIPFPGSLRLLILITSVLLASIILTGLVAGGHFFPWFSLIQSIAPFLLFHSVAGLILHRRVSTMIDSLGSLSVETQVVREGLKLLEDQRFQSAKMIEIATRVQNGPASVRKLERMLSALNERNKDWFYLPSRALMLGTQLCMAIEHWRMIHRSSLRVWLEAWAEFEALNALAGYAYENPDNVFPEFSKQHAQFDALAMGHPLLPRQTCVCNDVRLNQESRFYIVSGSNMSGKSTLLRAVGLNVVLALAGAPVRAQALRMSQLSVCASLSAVDSLLEGKSKFLAEVDRLRQMLDLARGDRPVLFLIDEIFGGTNSRDRRVAAEAVIRTLVGRGAIGALSTHDLALSEIANDEELCGANVHMGSSGKGDPMDFDYLLKPGVTKEANALTIARMAGVPL